MFFKILAVKRERGLHFGGNANNGSNAGSAYANANNAPSNTNANIGSHLCFNRSYPLQTVALAKKSRIIKKSIGIPIPRKKMIF